MRIVFTKAHWQRLRGDLTLTLAVASKVAQFCDKHFMVDVGIALCKAPTPLETLSLGNVWDVLSISLVFRNGQTFCQAMQRLYLDHIIMNDNAFDASLFQDGFGDVSWLKEQLFDVELWRSTLRELSTIITLSNCVAMIGRRCKFTRKQEECLAHRMGFLIAKLMTAGISLTEEPLDTIEPMSLRQFTLVLNTVVVPAPQSANHNACCPQQTFVAIKEAAKKRAWGLVQNFAVEMFAKKQSMHK